MFSNLKPLQRSDADLLDRSLDGLQAPRIPLPEPDLGDMRAHDVALSHLNARGFIQFHPLLAQRLNDFKAAIFLGHALYWSKHLAHIQPQRKGWIFMTATQWTQATGLSTREQATVRSTLVSRGLLLEALAGRPAVMHYKVELANVAKLLGEPELTWLSMAELFRPCIRFYKPLVDICGSVGAGLYLSYLLHRQSQSMRNAPTDQSTIELFPGEFVYRPEHARIALCLGVKAQRNAREKLKAAGFVREGRASNEVVATRVNLAAIASCLQVQGERSIRKVSPRKRPTLDAPRVAAVETPQYTDRAGAMLTRTKLPQLQLNLFTPVGLVSSMRQRAMAENQLAPQDDVAQLSPNTAPAPTAADLLLTLFTPWDAARHRSHETAATAVTLPGPNLSTEAETSGNSVALLSNGICPFVDPNLPFCRNYKEQGISRFLQTTTKAPVDNLTDEPLGRRRRVELSVFGKPETAVNQKIDATPSIRPASGVDPESRWGGSDAGQKSLVGPEIRDSVVDTPNRLEELEAALILPPQLAPGFHENVLATVRQAPVEMQQVFLDELAGHLAIPTKHIHNPPGWLHSLIRNHESGTAVLAMSSQVAELRERVRRNQERQAVTTRVDRKEPVSQVVTRDAGVTQTRTSEVSQVERQKLLELAAEFVTKRGGRR